MHIQVRLKKNFQNHVLFSLFIKAYNEVITLDAIVQNILEYQNIDSVEKFDASLGILEFNMICYGRIKPKQKQIIYISIQTLIYKTRQKILEKFNIKENNSFIKKAPILNIESIINKKVDKKNDHNLVWNM